MVFRSVSTWPVSTAALNTRPAGLAARRILISQAVDAVKLLTARPGKARVVRLDAAVAAAHPVGGAVAVRLVRMILAELDAGVEHAGVAGSVQPSPGRVCH